MFTEKADLIEVDQSKYYDGSALIDSPWLICNNEGVSFSYGGVIWANEGCTDTCDLEVIAYVPDRITDPDATYSGEKPTFTIQVYWSQPTPYLKDARGNTVNCIYTEGKWT